jgi:hypothetical protein
MTDEADREFALMRTPGFEAELAAVREVGRRVTFYAMLRGALVAINGRLRETKVRDKKGQIIQRSPGWIAHLYKDHYGEWPKREWDAFPPMPPNDEVLAAIKAKDSQWRRMFKQQREDDQNDRQRQMGYGEAADTLQQGAEGAGGMFDGGRVPGVEEQDDGVGELRETDE